MRLTEFENFLESIDLSVYRHKYQPVKIVEMDLPKEIQALNLLYVVYWTRKDFITYDEFYRLYEDSYRSLLENFRLKTRMCHDCFYLGLPARIYRTWASIITQIHAGYVAESVFGSGTVNMSSELDHQGADFQVIYRSHILNYQVKKNSFSREVRQDKRPNRQISGEMLMIKYEVPSGDYFLHPRKQDGSYRLPYLRFIENPQLKRLPNGFVVFTPAVFMKDKTRLDALSD